jgi:alcohol dehydrogenase/L-iditol 2-dehydrogenase
VDVNEGRQAFARQLGIATRGTDDGQVDLVVDTVGSPDANASALSYASAGATVLVLGLDDRPLQVDARTLVRRQLELRGSLTYDHPSDFGNTLARITAGEAAGPGRVLSRSFPIEDAQAAFEQGPSAPGKTWITVRAELIQSASA